jgi:hypothetical protein
MVRPVEGRPRSGGARGVRLGCAAGLTLIGALCLCGVLVVGRLLGFPGTQPAPAATPEPITGSAVLLADIDAVAYTDPNGTCREPSLKVTESPTRVSLALTETDAGLNDCLRGGDQTRGALEVLLAAPLGSRELLDATTGNPVPYFDQRRGLHLVFAIGSGWSTASDLGYGLVSTDAPYFRSPGAGIMVEEWTHVDQQNQNWNQNQTDTVLKLIQVSGGGWHPPPGTVTTPVTVRGHPGLAAAGIIVWTEAGTTVALQGYGPAAPTAAPNVGEGLLVDTAQLIKFSNQLGGVSP